MGQNNIEEIDTLEDTMVFKVEDASSTKELNVIREKNEVVDFTSPVKVLSDIKDTKGSKSSKNQNKSSKPKKEKVKREFKLLSNIKSWWSGLTKTKKIIFSCIAVLVLVLIALLIIWLTKDKKETSKDTKDVVLEADNYRYENGTLILLGEDEKELGKYECSNKDEKKCYVAYQSNEDEFTGDIYLDEQGERLNIRAKIINDNYVFIVDNKKGSNEDIILYSIKSKDKIDEYKLVKESSINKNYVVLKDKDNKYGVLDLTESTPKTLINFVYSYAGIIESDMANKYLVLGKNDKYYVSDYTEKLLSSGLSNKIVEYNDNYIVTKDAENKYNIYNYDGNQLQATNYLFIKLLNNYYAVLQDNGLIVYDNEGLKYNELPIGLSSTNYNRTYVFDANNQMISNDVAFEIKTEDDAIIITRGKATDNLYIKEAQANKEHPFMSYFNGILYFYKDESKTTLLGKYTCKNKNTVGVFDHCLIATTASFSNNDMTSNVPTGKVALLNDRFVFIKDSLSTGGIYLYDLQQSKKLGPYTDIEAVSDITSANELYKNINGAFVIAKNNKNLFGLLKINNQNVDVALGFNYQEIEKEGDYFLVKKSNGSYALYNNSLNEVTKEIPNKIVSYNDNYLVTKSSNSYNVYKHDGTKVDDKSYSYIKLESNYYVGISSNNLGIYKYTNPGENVLLSSVPIKSSDSYKDSNYFKVNASSLGYEITIQDGEHNKTYSFDKDGNEVTAE